MTSEMRIGIDVDNTIIRYDDVFLESAKDWAVVDPSFSGGKQAVRDAIRRLSDGELLWQKLQGHVYGKGISAATLFPGVDAFLRRCCSEGCTVLIVSHKTELGHYDRDGVNLREAALAWMAEQSFFDEDRYNIRAENVFWENTREDKLARIDALACTHFIDDLEEVLTDPAFAEGVNRFLLSESEPTQFSPLYVVCPTWRHIEEHVFGDLR
jgi:hypothetical protein